MPTPHKPAPAKTPRTKPRRAGVPLCTYQQRWVADNSRFKIAAKARRIGFTFATTLEIALDLISRRTRWLIISRTQDAAREALREIGNHFQAMRIAKISPAEIEERPTGLFFDGVKINKLVIELPNGSEVTAMTAHPDAARGFGGNVFLDEHGFHRDSEELWKGAAAAVLRGHRLIVVSTPHYQIGNYYRLAREADLVSGRPPLPQGVIPNERSEEGSARRSLWSAHWVDIHTAAPQLAEIGVPIDLAELRQLAGNDETWNQEFCCQFLSAAEMWIPLDLIAAARSPQAHLEWNPASYNLSPGTRNLFLGADIGRKHDRTAIWIDERIALGSPNAAGAAFGQADIAICRGLILLDRMPFERQYETFCSLLSLVTRHSSLPLIRRACIDQTGIGMGLVERLQLKFGARVEGVTFTADSKERMSLLVRRRFEERLDKIPENSPEIERDLAAVKRQTTSSGNLRFDADRTDAGHADIYWAKALADLAADSPTTAVCISSEDQSHDTNPSRDRKGADIWSSRREPDTGRPFPSIWDTDRDLKKSSLFA